MHMSAHNKVLNNLGHWTKFAVMKQWNTRSRNWKFTTSTHLLLCGQHSHNLSAVMSSQLLQLVNMSNFFCPPSFNHKSSLGLVLLLQKIPLPLRPHISQNPLTPSYSSTVWNYIFNSLALSLLLLFWENSQSIYQSNC